MQSYKKILKKWKSIFGSIAILYIFLVNLYKKEVKILNKRTKEKKKATIRERTPAKITLYSIRGEKIGELLPGQKVDFQSLIRNKQTKTYQKKRW